MSVRLHEDLIFWTGAVLLLTIVGAAVWLSMELDRRRCEASGRQLYHLGRSSICAYPHERVSDLARLDP